MNKTKKKIFAILIPFILGGCLPKMTVKDSIYLSEKEKEAFFQEECNPLLGALVNKSDDEATIQIYKKEINSWKLINEVKLKRRLENNAVCEEGNPIYLKYILLPDYGVYVISMIVNYKEIIDGEEVTFFNKKNIKFQITKDNKCDQDLKIGWYFEVIN